MATYCSPDLIKDLIPAPRPVDVALPPNAIVIAESAALFPPEDNHQGYEGELIRKCKRTSIMSNNKVDLRPKLEGKES